VSLLQSLFDILLAGALLWLAWRALSSTDLFKAVVLFIAFGLLMALAWVRLDALDIALAEAAVGAGLTGALLLAALARLGRQDDADTPGPATGRPRFPWLLASLLSVMLVGLGAVLLSLPAQAPGLSAVVAQNLDASGVRNPVTAVLINFRGYDTLLEMAVLLLALLGVWSLGRAPEQRKSPPGAVLELLLRLLVPVLIVVAGYLLWDGGHAPGGAFQAGAVLAAIGVLLILAGWHLGSRFAGLPQRIVLVTGLVMFVIVGLGSILVGGHLLEYPRPFSGALILLIESAATLSIGITLADLFLGGRPDTDPPGEQEHE
jgi:multisubunit Na+/H+ antiporter MnhB subunit